MKPPLTPHKLGKLKDKIGDYVRATMYDVPWPRALKWSRLRDALAEVEQEELRWQCTRKSKP